MGRVDILVNNAGNFDIADRRSHRSELRQGLAVYVKGLFFSLQAVAKIMIRQGRGGKIINMASKPAAGAKRRGRSSPRRGRISLTESAGFDPSSAALRQWQSARGVDMPMSAEVDAFRAM